ncbi:MAG: HAMP domain-containing sensor histidine kinase [Pseudomonadota bacterium]
MPATESAAHSEPLNQSVSPRLSAIGQPTSAGDPTARAIIDALPGAVLLLDRAGRITVTNDSAREWLDGPLEGELWREVFRREFAGELHLGELVNRRQRLLNISTRPFNDGAGQVVLLSDVTESRALQQAQERNLRLASIGEMLARLSHQVRTPISTAILYLTQMQQTALDDARRERFVQRSLSRLRHVEHMVRDMLMYAHGARLELEEVSIESVLGDLEEQLVPLAESNEIDHSITCTSNSCLHANRVGLVTALLNICCNAIENADKPLTLQISATQSSSETVTLTIDDNGPGIPLELREKVFQPFFTTRSDGTGLGLPVVKSVVDAHRGEVGIGDSSLGGTRFVLNLPGIASHTESPVHKLSKLRLAASDFQGDVR